MRRRYVVIGTGHRVRMYLDAITGDQQDVAELAALIDVNPGRLAVHAARLGLADVLTGPPDELETLIAKSRADRAIITSPDFTHAGFVAATAALLATSPGWVTRKIRARGSWLEMSRRVDVSAAANGA